MTAHNASIHGDPAHRASVHRPAGYWPAENAAGSLTLDFDARHRRRFRLTGDQGDDVLLDLPEAVAMAEGSGRHRGHCRSQTQRSYPADAPGMALG